MIDPSTSSDAMTRTSAETDETALERGFHFIIVLWGARFCDYFLDYCLPSMLSPGNIPALRTRNPSKFLIATRPDDWERMRATAIFRKLERYVTPVFIEIPPCPPGRSGCEHMGIGHKMALQRAFEEKAYAMVVTPDSMLSDGSVARLQDLARGGTKLALAVALRFGEETFFAGLRGVGLIGDKRPQDTGDALTITGPQMAAAAVNGLHRETLGYEWDAPIFTLIPAANWWRVPGEEGIVIHSLSWAPLLIDFAAIQSHDTTTLDHWTLDGDYIHRNVDWREATHIVQDSDEMFLASWAPMDDGPPTTKPTALLKFAFLRDPIHGAQLRRVYHSYISDPMKRDIFFKPVRWHARPINENWLAVERKSLAILATYLNEGDGGGEDAKAVTPLRRAALNLFISVWLGVFHPLCQLWIYRRAVTRRLYQILRGDPAAFNRVMWHLRWSINHILGRPFYERPPPPPVTD
jgi:hypothetical protein